MHHSERGNCKSVSEKKILYHIRIKLAASRAHTFCNCVCMICIIMCSDVAGFSFLTSQLHPQEAVRIIDHFHALIDEIFTHPDIFLMERTSSGCIAASGLVETYPEPCRSGAKSQLSMTDSSYGSVLELDLNETKPVESRKTTKLSSTFASQVSSAQHDRELDLQQRLPQHHSSVLATAALKLMSTSSRIEIPGSENQQLQLRIALHTGPCSAGVIGLQTASGVSRIPHYKLFGPSLKYTHNLCMTGLALQIRVSKPCQELLASTGLFQFERCPDYTMWSAKKPIESFWLVGREGMEQKLPSLGCALPLTEYDDTEI